MRIERLSPEHVEAFLRLFDASFSDNPAWAGCYCEFYETSCPDAEWDPAGDASLAARNRADRARAIEEGTVQGLLAFESDEPIGWLSADRRDNYGNLRKYDQAVEPDDPPTGSIMCFVVPPAHRGRGVATALLAAADDHLRDLGARVAEAYPRSVPPGSGDVGWTSAFYKGSRAMFENAGYAEHRQLDGWTVMRKPLT